MNPVTVIYHANCPDGITAAWIARAYVEFFVRSLALNNKVPNKKDINIPEIMVGMFGPGDGVTYVPASYGDSIDDLDIDDHEVYILDFSYDLETMKEISKRAHTLTIIDHHKTSQGPIQDLQDWSAEDGNVVCVFDDKRSGAGLTWHHFYPHVRIPWIIRNIEKGDLWDLDEESMNVRAVCKVTPFNFDEWDVLMCTPKEVVSEKGKIIREYIQQWCEEVSENSFVKKEAMNTEYTAAMCCSSMVNASELGHHLLQRYDDADFSVIYNQSKDMKWKYSLRSRDGGVDVSEIASSFGGGGHHCAAGFVSEDLLML